MSRAGRRSAFVGGVVLWLGAGVAHAGEVSVTAPAAEGGAGEVATVGLHVAADADVSALQGGLAYDPAVVEVVEVVAGPALPEGARADFNADQRGWLRFGFVASPSKAAYRGAGEALRVRFRMKGAVGATSPLGLASVRAWQPDDVEHRTVLTAGSLRVVAATGGGNGPLLAIGGVLLLLLLVLVARFGRRRRAPPAAAGPRARSGPAQAAPRGGPPAGRSRFCSGCGAPVPNPQARFCSGCGGAL